jgi:hypothetical protein
MHIVARVSGQVCKIPMLVKNLGIRFFSIAMWHFMTYFACNGLLLVIIDVWRSVPCLICFRTHLTIREVLIMEFWLFKENNL